MRILNLFVICILIASCQVRHDYKIAGNIEGIPDSTVIDLYVQYGDLASRVASDTIVNGKFMLTDSIGDGLLNMYLKVRDIGGYYGKCELWVRKGDIKVSGAGKYLSAWKVNSNIQEQKDHNRLMAEIGSYSILIDSLSQVQMLNYQNNINDNGVIEQKIDSIREISNSKELDFLKNNYNSLVSVIHLYKLAQFGDSLQKAEIKGFYNKIDTTYLNTLWGEGLINRLNKTAPPEVGDKYVDFKAYDLDGNTHQLSNYIGKYILLDFWSMGCYPCIMSLPELRKLSDEYKDNLVVVGVNVDINKKFWEDASKRDSITWVNLSDGKGFFGGASLAYGIEGVPTFILINPEGIIVEILAGFRSGVFEKYIINYLREEQSGT